MQKIKTERAPEAIGPYSQAVVIPATQKLIFVSGQLPVDPMTGKLIEGDTGILTNRVIDHIEAILKAAGSSLEQVVRTDVFLIDLKEFKHLNEVYAERFKGMVQPARQTIQVAALPLGASLEISCIAWA